MANPGTSVRSADASPDGGRSATALATAFGWPGPRLTPAEPTPSEC
jgi:hypothetical protein